MQLLVGKVMTVPATQDQGVVTHYVCQENGINKAKHGHCIYVEAMGLIFIYKT